MRKLVRPTTDLSSDGEILNAYDLNRRGAFSRPMVFPFRRLKTFPDHIELRWPNPTKPSAVMLIERTKLNYGGTRPWFICSCGRRCAKLYLTSISVGCRICNGLQYKTQRERRKARLTDKAERIRSSLWVDAAGKPIRPRFMHKTVFHKHLLTLQRIEHAIRTNGRYASVRYRRLRNRDTGGRYL